MDFSVICRTCRSDANLNPIFLNPDDHKRYSTAVYLTTGIKVSINDGLPQQMCTSCINYLNESLKFRKKCRDTEVLLLKLKRQFDFENTNMDDELISTTVKETIALETKQDGLIENLKQERTEIKTDYYDSDDDDKPLKYFVDTDSVSDTEQALVYLENELEHTKSDVKLEALNTEVDNEKSEFEATQDYTSNPKRVTCQLCQKNLSIRSIDSHMVRRHPGADERRVKCELCDTHVLRNKMRRHERLVHGTGNTLRCGYCKTEYDSKEVLVDHVASCTAKKKKRKVCTSSRELCECDVCHKTMQKASLRMHKEIKHAGLGPVCEHCGRRFGNKFRLNEHYRAKHGYDKFKCSYCDFQSAGVMAMRNHERRHRGEKPFVCETCGAKFHAAYLLAQHKQSHRTEKLIKCDLCPASFKANNSLHMHKITCHSSSLFKCTMCSRAYSCRHYAVKHLRHVHNYRGPVPPLQKVDSDAAPS